MKNLKFNEFQIGDNIFSYFYDKNSFYVREYISNSQINIINITNNQFKTILTNDSCIIQFIIYTFIDLIKKNKHELAINMITQLMLNKPILNQDLNNTKIYLFDELIKSRANLDLIPYPSQYFIPFAYLGYALGSYRIIHTLMYNINDKLKAQIFNYYMEIINNNSTSAIIIDNINQYSDTIPIAYYIDKIIQYLLLIPGLIVAPFVYLFAIIGLIKLGNSN